MGPRNYYQPRKDESGDHTPEINPTNRPDGLISSLKAITINVKGMYKSKDALNALIAQHDPDIHCAPYI
jgi:hypothetical protein